MSAHGQVHDKKCGSREIYEENGDLKDGESLKGSFSKGKEELLLDAVKEDSTLSCRWMTRAV